jgi:site-specific recombinase XerD
MTRAKRYQITPEKHLDHAEVNRLEALLAFDVSEVGLAIRLLLETGARVSELLQLPKSALLRDSKSLSIMGIKGSLDRVIPLKDRTFHLLATHIASTRGISIFTFKKRWLQHQWTALYAAKIETAKSLHSLRHTFAIELFKLCRDVRLVQQALGHASINNTMVYASYVYSVEDLRRVMIKSG